MTHYPTGQTQLFSILTPMLPNVRRDSDATQKGKIKESHIGEHQNGNASRKTAKAGSSYRNVKSRKKQKKEEMSE